LLLTAIQDASPVVRRAATAALAPLEEGRVLEPLVRALQEQEQPVRQRAAEALAHLLARVQPPEGETAGPTA
jgi:HEAT repeat protein